MKLIPDFFKARDIIAGARRPIEENSADNFIATLAIINRHLN